MSEMSPIAWCDSQTCFKNVFWTTMKLCGIEEQDLSPTSQQNQLIVDFGLFMGFVDKKNTE